MVTIVNPVPSAKVLKNIICRKCGVELSYVPNDVHTRSSTDYSGGSDVVKWIVCPACNAEVVTEHY